MTAELLAHNVAAHWIQAGGVAGAAWLGVTVLRLRGSAFLLRYWQAVLLLLPLTPWLQPWQPVATTPAHGSGLEPELAGAADVLVAASIVALPAERWSVDPWTGILGLLAAGVVVRLLWLGLGLVRLGRLARAAHRVAPPEPARQFLSRFRIPPVFVQPPDARMPCSFGLFRPTVRLPAAFDRLEPGFQRDIVYHELVHLEQRDFVAAMVEETVASLLWFHPWVWLIRRRIQLHRERVVDAAVVHCTGDRRAYVRCLVALAGYPHALPLAAPALRPTELRARTDALFEKAGAMSKRRSAALSMGLWAAFGATVWTAATAAPLRSATTGPAVQAPVAGRTAPQVENDILLDFTLPSGGRTGAGSPDGELTSTRRRGAGTLGFVARRRDDARGVVTVAAFDLDGAPDREMGTIDMTVATNPVTFPGPAPFEIAVPGIVRFFSGSPPSARGRAEERRRPWIRGALVAQVLPGADDPERADAWERTNAVLNELQQAVAGLSDQLEDDEPGEDGRIRQRMRERLGELQEQLAGLNARLAGQ